MPAFIATIGTFDFAAYLRVGDGEGMDPYSASFEEPAWTEGPFAEGQPLANVDVQNREQSWPLYLNDGTKDELHALVRTLNKALRYEHPLTLTWQDDGASDPTFYDVAHARFEPAFSLRKSEKGWLAGTLRVWTAPYGHTGTYRVLPFGSGIASVATLAGDVGANLQVSLSYQTLDARTTATPAYPGEIVTLCAAIPATPSFLPQWSPSQLANTSIGAATHAPYGVTNSITAAGAWGMTPIAGMASLSPSAYAGRQRILALMRHNAASGYYARLMGGNATPLVSETPGLPTVFLGPQASGAWRMVDLGVVDVDPLGAVAAIPRFVWAAPFGSLSINTIEVGALFTLPEDSTSVLLDPLRPGALNGATSTAEANIIMRSVDNYVRRDENTSNPSSAMRFPYANDSRMLRGSIPDLVPSQSAYVSMWKTGFRDPKINPGVTVAVRERFTFAR